jgi:hypothetical protein
MRGAEAEKVFFGNDERVVGDCTDQERATNCLKKVGVPGAQYVQDDAWDRYEDRLRKRAAVLVRHNRHTIERVALALPDREELTAEEIDTLIGIST